MLINTECASAAEREETEQERERVSAACGERSVACLGTRSLATAQALEGESFKEECYFSYQRILGLMGSLHLFIYLLIFPTAALQQISLSPSAAFSLHQSSPSRCPSLSSYIIFLLS